MIHPPEILPAEIAYTILRPDFLSCSHPVKKQKKPRQIHAAAISDPDFQFTFPYTAGLT
jgi:hypothetical protein